MLTKIALWMIILSAIFLYTSTFGFEGSVLFLLVIIVFQIEKIRHKDD